MLLLLLQCAQHQVYCGTAQSPEYMLDVLERGKMHFPFDLCVSARAVYGAIAGSDPCEFAGCSLTLHLISLRDRMMHGLMRRFYWVDTMDMLADGLTKGKVDRFLFLRVSNGCLHEAEQLTISHTKVGPLPNLLDNRGLALKWFVMWKDLDDLGP